MRLKDPFWDYSDLALFIGLVLPSLLVTALAAKLLESAPKAVALIVAQSVMYLVLFAGLYAICGFGTGCRFGKDWGLLIRKWRIGKRLC